MATETELEEPGLSQDGPTWKELLGSHNWEGLLDPLNDDLRRLILRCGDFCQVTYDTFINDQASAYCGASRYAKVDLLEKTAFPGGSDKYDVVGFLYATARVSVPEAFLLKSRSREKWDKESNWIGYIAVSNDQMSKEIGRREIYVAWRGTIRDYEWVDVLGAQLLSAKPLLRHQEGPLDDQSTESVAPMKATTDNGTDGDDEGENEDPKVMAGWLTIYTSEDPKSPFTKLSARTQLLTKLKQLIDQYKGEDLSITFAGHSLGATLSVVSAFDVAENLTTEIPVSAIVFGCPKVGNKSFKTRFDSYPNLKVLHVRNVIDLIPLYPFKLLGYVNIGTELEIDTRKSNFLKDSKNPSDWHNLQAILHIVNGWHGVKEEFKLVIKRSIAIVNKSCDFLKEEYLVPPSWWIEKNKGMTLNEAGEWVFGHPEEDPTPEFD
ncbi:phospholipase A1-IIdelta-like isoform X2 [Beta vulgaris subsp. vulgaris]|uniref:phospholipase A1-IIdelta-like isoform X2 n=1 Tax=Beta vulgaris subsp. vulgaris TaxID=3555 RepID=UPI00203760C4|nr:phospholipase A1-IIdelta-like isoform X2 [Beta vulgaris subsp. vulgaris]